jgi:hypothetical protein
MLNRRAILVSALVLLAIAVLAPSSARAQACTITSGGASYVIPATSHYDNSQTSNLTGVGASDILFEDGWWFRVSSAGDTREFFFPAPDTTTCAGANGTITWTNVSARGLFSAINTLAISSAGANQGEVILTMSITNLSASNPLAISLYHGADFDVNATAAGDSAALLNPNNYIRITDSVTGTADQRGFNPPASAYLVRPFGATDVFVELDDTGIDNLPNTGLPATNIDYTGALQWDLNIPASGTAAVSVSLTGNVTATPVELIDATVE